MKNPIKNGKEVFAVLSMATVMSISMSVKVDAASETEVVAKSAAHAVESSMDKAPSKDKVEETISAKEDATKLEDNKEALVEDTKVTETGSPEVSEGDSLVESDKGPTEEVKEKTALVEENKSQTKPLAEDTGAEVEKLEVEEEKTPQAQRAGETPDQGAENSGAQKEDDKNLQKADDPNYGEDEKKIEDYDGSERYKQTDLQPGDPNQTQYKTDEKKVKDGFKFEFKNPSSTSPSKTEYGYQITIDKKTGQRTYTSITVTDGGRVPVPAGEKPMMGQGEKLTPESPDVTYQPTENSTMDAFGAQRNLNYVASEDTLRHINNKDNDSTSFGMKDNYTQDNPGVKFFGGSFALGYKVNPWPNENDKLEQLKLNGQYNEKVFVKGQDIDTGIKVDNIDDNAKERLVGQVYNPITGKVVPGASAYIKNGTIHVKLPDGALKKDESGKTVINEESIFNTDDYKALQNLDVKFFARPRTAEEFKKIAETPDEFGEKGTYTGSEAGTADINHKGTNVTIDKQGIDRYDHYNLIGGFKLNLDDTRYYDQSFKDGHKEDTSEKTYSKVKPGEAFDVEMYNPKSPKPNQKTADEMNEADKKGEASGRIIMDFINKENEGKAEKDQWKIDVDEHDISKFTITPPKSAKSGDFVAVPIEYTYTNGSKDIHYFHFVVQESTNNRPEYHVQVEFPSIGQKSKPDLPKNEDKKKLDPVKYTIQEGAEFKDDHGNEWNVSIDETTGQVTAKPKDPRNFSGGEKLEVPVVAHYIDKNDPEKVITEEDIIAEFTIKERFNKTPRYNAKAGKVGDTLSSDIILDKNDTYNREPGKFSLASNTFVDDKGNTWNVSIDENSGKVTATVPNAEEGKTVDGALLNIPVIAHYYEKQGDKLVESGTKEVEAQFMAYGTNGKVEKTVEVPFETKVEKDPNLKKGEIKVITEGKKGSKKVTYTIEDSKIIKEEEQELEAPQVREIHVGEGVNDGTHKIEEKVEVPFETEIEFDDSLAPGEKKVTQEGEAGEKKRDITLTIEDGNVTKTETGEFTETKAPKKRIIKVGRNTEGKVEHKEELPFKYKVEEVDTLKKGEYKIVKPGKVGTKTTTWTIKNSQIDGKPTETIDPAEDALIQVGKGTVEGTHEVTEKKNIDYKTVIEYDENLDAGQQEVIKEGNPGEQERTNTLVIKDGQVTETKEGEFKTTKEATDRVVKIGTKPVTKVVEKPFNTEYVYDENLESGKTEEVTPGKNGKVTITTSYDKDQKKVVTSETEEAGQNRVVKIGGKTNGTEKVKEEIPFEVEVKKDPSLKKGEWKYATDDEGNELKGEKGEQEKTLTIVNSKVTETSEPTVTKKAKNAVILVGEGTNDGTHEIVEKKNIDYKTVIEYDENLDAGQQEVVKEGNPGEQERTNTLVIKDGQVTETKEGEFKTTKEATDRVVKIGTKPVTKVVEKPFNTEYVYDENLESGKTEEVTPGKNGKVTITTSYDKDQKKVVTSETEEPGQNRVVKIGGKTNGTEKVKEEIPFEVEVRKDPSLKKGEWKYATDDEGNELKGEKGEQEKTLTIVNSKVTETSEPTVTKKAKNAVILVGEDTNDGTHEITEKKELPFETRYEYDDSLEPGEEKVVTPGSPGEQERTNTLVIKDGKVVETQEGEFKTTKEPQERLIKIGRKPSEGETTKTVEREIHFDTKVIYDETLEAGSQVIEKEGKLGKEEVTITQKIKDSKPEGEATETTKTITEKEDRVVRVGVKPVVKETELGNNTEYRHNPELKAGEEKVIEEGSKGSVKYTTTFNKETGKLEVKEERTEPKNKVVEYGSKTEGEFTYESEKAYDIIIRENPDLEAGKTNVIQEGKPGKTETTVKVENSKEVSRDTKTITEKQDKIIEIGTKNVCEIPPVDPENPTDPEKPGKEDPEKPGKEDPEKPGKEDPEKPGKEDPEKPGEEDPEKPGKDRPNTPSKPGNKTPNKPEDKTPNKIVENPSEDPKDSPQESPEEPKTEDVKDIEKNSTPEETREVEKKENLEDDNLVKNKGIERQVTSDDKAPKTGDAGLAMETASAGLASGLLLLLKRFKRRKDDEE